MPSLFAPHIELPAPVYLAQWDGKAATLATVQAYVSSVCAAFPANPPITVAMDAQNALTLSWTDGPSSAPVQVVVPSGSWFSPPQPAAQWRWNLRVVADVAKQGFFRSAQGSALPASPQLPAGPALP